MKIILKILFFITVVFAGPSLLQAQSYHVDSSQRAMDVSGDFKGAEIHLPAVAKKPGFPGGKKAWQDFLRSNIDIKIPFKLKAAPGMYRVMIWFIVGSDGNLRGIGADSNAGYGMEAEVIRAIKKTPDWIQAETGTGKKVSYTLRTLVNFTIQQTDVIISF